MERAERGERGARCDARLDGGAITSRFICACTTGLIGPTTA